MKKKILLLGLIQATKGYRSSFNGFFSPRIDAFERQGPNDVFARAIKMLMTKPNDGRAHPSQLIKEN